MRSRPFYYNTSSGSQGGHLLLFGLGALQLFSVEDVNCVMTDGRTGDHRVVGLHR